MTNLPVRRRRPAGVDARALEPTVLPQDPAGAPYGPYIEFTSADSNDDDFSKLLQYWNVLILHKGALLIAVLCGALIAFVVSLYQTPIYIAATKLEFQGSERQPFEGISFINNGDSSLLPTQVQLLKSRMLQDRVYARLSDKVHDGIQPVSTPLGSVREWLGFSSPEGSSGWGEAIAWSRKALTVTPVRDTRIVQIVSESTLPQAAADYVNTLAEVFIENNREERWSLYETTGAWLEKAQQELKTKLEESERQLLAYSSASGLIVTSKDENVAEQKLLQLQAELSRAQGDRIEKEARYRTAESRPAESLGDMLDRGPMATYEVRLADLRRELADATTSLTAAHPRVRRLQAQVEELSFARSREQTNILNRLRIEYETAVQREQQLVADFATQSKVLSAQDQKLIRYKMLQREVDTYRKLYDTTLQRGKEASLASALAPVNARLIDPARSPSLPSTPNLPRNMVFGLVAGAALGVGLVLVRDRMDASIRTRGSILSSINLRELGVIPSARSDPRPSIGARPARFSIPGTVLSGTAANLRATVEPVELVTWNRKTSLVAESFRATLTSILMSQNGNERQIILVTSPSPQEGKSTVVTNLAIGLAEIHQRVLLIDADLRRPRLHAIFNQANTWGLSDLLQETTPCAEYPTEALARATHVPGLFSLPSGAGSESVSRLLHSARMAELLDRLRTEFDAVLIDSPPVLSVADARILSRHADAVVMVVRAGQTTREAATMAVDVFEADGVPLLGTVLNDWDPRTANGYYSSEYGQYYGDAADR